MSGLRERYTWHLRAPFDKAFDRAHWWEKVSMKDVHPIAALYELVRRHPRVGELRTNFAHRSWHGVELRLNKEGDRLADAVVTDAYEDLGSGPKALHCLCLIGLKSWNQHYSRDQEFWMMSGGRLKGVDCRDEIEQCTSITSQALSDLYMSRLQELKPPPEALSFHVPVSKLGVDSAEPTPVNPGALKESQHLMTESLRKKPFTCEEMDEMVARNSISSYRAGDFVFAVAPDLTLERATEVLTNLYRRQQEHDFGDRERARWTDWLPSIAEFENAELTQGGAKSGTFTRYRRILDGIDFERELSITQKLTGWTKKHGQELS